MQNLPKKVRSRKLSTRVDLTAMVSVSFLLIIFFMVATELRKPKSMDLSMPDKEPMDGIIICRMVHSPVTTVLLGENNKLVSYTGILDAPISAPKEMKYGKEGIRKELFKQNKSMLEYSAQLGKPGRGITVIIKPSKKSNFKNLIDILDEMAIVNIQTYAVVNDFSPEETKLLASN